MQLFLLAMKSKKVVIQKSLKDEHHIDNILPQLQNINFAGGTSRYRYIQIRGLGELSQFAEMGFGSYNNVSLLFARDERQK